MPKPPQVKYVITEPAVPGWWRLHRHQVYGITCLLLGMWLCHECTGTAADPGHHPTPGPAHSTTRDPSIQPLPDKESTR
ncbi:hypothetical protein G5C51_09360 [Streptomyces sp. A7024]|uniref:Uncharacterized protein n=1 Tax=Streptomyces coryli TaxID=1128680 RepID=A0A6G4TX64_9ACTN|nr:hypothetical protein [Streptomyces coryli]NGN64110.1 hypothetical protein [Streptomyces coryli]